MASEWDSELISRTRSTNEDREIAFVFEEYEMPTVDEVLEQDQEDYPDWLQQTKAADNAALANFFSSRVVYYPGSGTHGRAISSFGASHSAHCFLHIDQLEIG